MAKAAAENRRLAKIAKHPLFRQDHAIIRYRVEIWRVDEPEIRLTQFPMEYENGKFSSRDMVAQISETLFGWLDRRINDLDRIPGDRPVDEDVWNTPYDYAAATASLTAKDTGSKRNDSATGIRKKQPGKLFDPSPSPRVETVDDDIPF
jgi:hypothetical protein